MSKPQTTRANERPAYGPPRGGAGFGRGAGGHGPGGHGQGSGEKAVSFGASMKRLIGLLRPNRVAVSAVIGMTILGTVLNSVGPVILGQGTNIIFDAVVLQHIPIDFAAIARVLAIALAVYLGYFTFAWASAFILNTVVQRVIYRMRRDVSEKLDRLPLRYFDQQPRGELLSRVTNDVDNISQTMQQTLSQILSNVFTLIGVVTMMFVVSWPLALVALVSIPIALTLTVAIGKRSQRLFKNVWRSTGELNSQVEEAYSGHDLVTVFGRRREVGAAFAAKNQELYESSFGAQFISGIIMPVMFFVGNLNYVAIAIFGGLMVTNGSLSIGSVQAFIQYSRMFTHPITGLASMANLLQSGVASAERVFEVLDAPEEPADLAGSLPETVQGRVSFEHVTFGYSVDRPLIHDLSFTAQPGCV